jgi:hypothetical protein
MKKLICNYSVIRFLPYPETGEFVNVGILACCPQVGWMNFILEPRKTKRISDFFPELDMQVYRAGRHHVATELDRMVAEHRLADQAQWALPTHQQYLTGIFTEIIRPREELFRFGAPATLLTANPFDDLQALFNHYVERHFAQHKDYQETLMTNRLTELFRAENLIGRYRREQIGNEEYHVTLPFVERIGNDLRPARAIKPLNLMQTEATQIRDHGDAWRTRVERLKRMEYLPRHMLFAVQCPPVKERNRYDAAMEICDLLQKEGVEIAPFGNHERVTRFAAQVD